MHYTINENYFQEWFSCKFATFANTFLDVTNLFMNIFSLDDVDHDKSMSTHNKDKKKLYIESSSMKVNVSVKWKTRAGVTAFTLAICNESSDCVDFRVPALQRRVYLIPWKDEVTSASANELESQNQCIEAFIESVKGRAVDFMRNVDLSSDHQRYLRAVCDIYQQFADPQTIKNTMPHSLLEFAAIVYQVSMYICARLVKFDMELIRENLAENWRKSYEVKICLKLCFVILCLFTVYFCTYRKYI